MDDLSLDLMMHIKEICMNNLCGPRDHYIIITQNPRALDRCLNKGLIIRPYECTKDNKQLNKTTQLNPRVYFINLTLGFLKFESLNSISFIVGPINQKK